MPAGAHAYDGPAGFVMTREEALAVCAALAHDNRAETRIIRDRLRRYLQSTWQADADELARSQGR